MSITRVHHHTFTVSEMDRSIHFYKNLLGMKLSYDKVRENVPAYDQVMGLKDVKVRVVLLTDPSDHSTIALLQYHNPAPTKREMGNLFVGTSILCLETTDIDSDYARLVSAGVRFSSSPVDVIRDGKLAARLTYAFDPDDIVVELYQPAGT